VEIAANDLLLVKGSPDDLVAILRDKVVELPHLAQDVQFAAEEKESLIVEMIIPPQSSLLGVKLLETHLQKDPDIHSIAVKRRSFLYTEQTIQNAKLRVGDTILSSPFALGPVPALSHPSAIRPTSSYMVQALPALATPLNLACLLILLSLSWVLYSFPSFGHFDLRHPT
jgi:hypothetical protein